MATETMSREDVQGIFAMLARPFEPEEVKLRTQAGRQLQYVTARTVMNRLDEVIGPDNWEDEYVPSERSVLCRLTVTLPDGRKITKVDAGGMAGMADPGDDDKSGFADGFKRAAVKFGVGRYLYRDGIPDFARHILGDKDPQTRAESRHDSGGGGYQPAQGQPHQQSPQGNANGAGGGQRTFAPSPAGEMPRDGRKLWGWCLDRQKEGNRDIVNDVNAVIEKKFGRMKMVDMSGEQVAAVWPLIVGSANGGGRSHQDPADEDDIPY